MTCQNCVRQVKESLDTHPDITSANVQLSYPQASLKLKKPISAEDLDQLIGKYNLSSIAETLESSDELAPVSITTYKPLILIVAFISGVSLLAQYPFESYNGKLWMRHFMAGFFIVFSFFKLLNLKGFAESYSMYDILAGQWKGWGYIYPFIELGLGVLYLTNLFPRWTNYLTIIILGISSIGVIQSNLNKRKIKCACLGDVFNLPMSTVTIIENVSMVGMAILMLFSL